MPILIPPAEEIGSFSDGKIRGTGIDLWRFYTFPQGLAIVLRDGVWGTEVAVGLDGAQRFYLGGHIHHISDTEAAELIAAGFGQYITPDDGGPGEPPLEPPGYGRGTYGSGAYGD